MERIAIDTIGSIDEDFGLRHIIVIIDTSTRYVELLPQATFQLWQRPTLSSTETLPTTHLGPLGITEIP